MLEITRRELIQSAIAAAGLMATSTMSSAAAPQKADRLLDTGTFRRRSVAPVSADQQGHHGTRRPEAAYGRTGRTEHSAPRMDQAVPARRTAKHNC